MVLELALKNFNDKQSNGFVEFTPVEVPEQSSHVYVDPNEILVGIASQTTSTKRG